MMARRGFLRDGREGGREGRVAGMVCGLARRGEGEGGVVPFLKVRSCDLTRCGVELGEELVVLRGPRGVGHGVG